MATTRAKLVRRAQHLPERLRRLGGNVRQLRGNMRQLRSNMRQLRGEDWLLLSQTSLLVVGVRLGLRVLPFRTLDRILGHFSRARRDVSSTRRAGREGTAFDRNRRHDGDPPAEANPYAERAAWAVGAVSKRLLRKRPCLTQALVLRLLLRRRGLPATLQIGVGRGSDGTFSAHAWLESDGRVLIGGKDAPDTYPHPMALDTTPVLSATRPSSDRLPRKPRSAGG